MMRHFFSDMLEMESPAGYCHLHDSDMCGADSYESSDFSCVCFPCQPWSSLSNRADKPSPSAHPDFKNVFGTAGSSVSLMRSRKPSIALFENVEGFMYVTDDTGRTGVQRLCDEMFDIKVPEALLHWFQDCQAHHGPLGRTRPPTAA